jgi:DNA (cytosine-5)-methyltransferase 1
MITFADLFAGGGGTSTGAFMVPGIHVSWALNHDPIAIKTHEVNHPETKHYQADIRTQNVKELDPVDVLWASLECTNHSKAKGGKDKDEGSFTLGWELPRYLVHCNPDYLYIENVPEFIRWGELKDGKRVKDKEGQEYVRWIRAIKALGYVNYERRFLNAADYGCPTRRIRYFGIFSKPGCPIMWPRPSHAERENLFGLPKWKPCKDYIDLTSEGNSIFGREHNEDVYKGRRTPLSENTLRRIAGGIKKFAPDVYFVMQYYGNGLNCQSIEKPLNTVTTKDRHALVKVEKMQFIQDHCHTSSYNLPDEPLRPQLTRQTKQLITVEKKFISKYFSNSKEGGRQQDHCQGLDQPSPTITCRDHSTLVTARAQFYTRALTNDFANQPLEKPAPTIMTWGTDALVTAKIQFISHYFNGNGHPESQNQSLHGPLNSITTNNKGALVTISQDDLVDFDIKMRFLTDEELAAIMGFPKGYFKRPGLKLSKKEIIKMIGNAVPVGMARALLEPMAKYLIESELERVAV